MFQADAFQNDAFQILAASVIGYRDVRDVNIIYNPKTVNSLYLTKAAEIVDRDHDVREYVRD